MYLNLKIIIGMRLNIIEDISIKLKLFLIKF